MNSKVRQREPVGPPDKPGACGYCQGRGRVESLFSGAQVCNACQGTGLDADDPALVPYLLHELAQVRALAGRTAEAYRRYRGEIESLFSADEINHRREIRHAERHSSRFD